MGYSKEGLAKKNVFPQKYDEIRRLDGIQFNITFDAHAVLLDLEN
jgi:hypothetical protein